jgi:3-dehydroquinate dehydratase/shikimate dehydrogenase
MTDGGRPDMQSCQLIASVGGDDAVSLARRLGEVDRRADLVELRLDRVSRPQVAGLVAAAPLPAVATCRRRADGGAFEGDESERAARLEAAAQAGAAWVDVEMGSDLARAPGRFAPARVILSWHDFSGTPRDLPERLRAMRAVPGVHWRKVVTTARRLDDLAAVRRLFDGGGDLIAFAMGACGAASRLLAPAWGAPATYAAGSGEPTAPGQFQVGEMLDLYRLRSVGAATRVAGLLGCPLGHSLSPRLHNAAYAALGLDWVYVPLESESVEGLRDLLEALDVQGASVTIPHKEAVLRHLDEIEPLARQLGAANTIVRRGGALRGYNTDAEAALGPLREALPLAGRRVVLLGAGGAARALAFTLGGEGCRVKIFNRTAERARRLAAEAGTESGEWETLAGEPYDILINATPAGMHPRLEESPVPEAWLRGLLVYDIVYNPADTALLRAARRRGIAALGGGGMFVRQAAAQFELFTGAAPPLDVLRECVSRALSTQI